MHLAIDSAMNLQLVQSLCHSAHLLPLASMVIQSAATSTSFTGLNTDLLLSAAAGEVRPEGGEAEDGRLEGVELEEVPHTPHLGGVVVVGGQRVQVRVNMGLRPPCSRMVTLALVML